MGAARLRRDGGLRTMSVLYLVRHGQASFLQDNYDQLSPLGIEQAQLLGQYWASEGIQISEVYAGSLARQQQTAEAVGSSIQAAGMKWPEPTIDSGFDEYSSDAIMGLLRAELQDRDAEVRRLSEEFDAAREAKQRYRSFHRLLEALMGHYLSGDYESEGIESWPDFHRRVQQSLDTILRRPGRGRHVAVFTSGGPIGIAVQAALQAPEQRALDLHFRIYNAAVTAFQFSSRRITLDQFNTIPHLISDRLRTYR